MIRIEIALFMWLIAGFWTKEVLAETFLYLQNNSDLSFEVNSTQTGTHTMDNDEWWGMNGGVISPWASNANVLWTNRNEGVHNGDDFYFTATLSYGNESIYLKLKVEGNFIGSDMWHSLGGDTFNHPWQEDQNFYTENITFAGRNLTLKYAAYEAGTYNDVLFVVHDNNPYPPIDVNDATNPNVLNVLAYNIYMLSAPIALSNQTTRAAVLPTYLQGFDALIISEAFDNNARSVLLDELSVTYPYYTDVVDESGAFEDGGVFIASKWPIEYSNDVVYDACNAEDCLAAKGAMYARINKLGVPYHLFGTHTQAWNETNNVYTRQAQFEELNAFIAEQAISPNEAVIIGGDLNVDKLLNNLNEYNDMFTILQANEPVYTGYPYTYDGNINYYGGDSDTEFLDYVLEADAYRTAISVTNKVQVMRAIEDDMWQIFDLSDHLAVHGRLVYAPINDKLHIKVLLEGAYDSATNTMHTQLNEGTYLPNNQPYSAMPWEYNGTETLNDLGANTVDWLLVEAQNPTNQAVLERTAVLLQKDGSVISSDGTVGASFYSLNPSDTYAIVLRHRNHLAVKTTNALSLNNNPTIPYNFTDVAQINGGSTQLTLVNPTTYALKAGDASANGIITYTDFTIYAAQLNQTNAYTAADFNLDGTVTTNDFLLYQKNANSIGVLGVRY